MDYNKRIFECEIYLSNIMLPPLFLLPRFIYINIVSARLEELEGK
jgi:hypothetical protein